MCTIDIGIGHDHNLMVTQFFQVNSFGVFLSTDRNPQSLENYFYFIAFIYPVHHSLLYIQDFSPQG